MKGKMYSRAGALEEFFRNWKYKLQTENISLQNAHGRICAENICSCLSLPVVRSSARDGIAVRSADFTQKLPDTKNWKQGVDYVRADTGDDFDDAFDAVIQIEDVNFTGDDGFEINSSIKIKPGMNINKCGALVTEKEVIFERGLPIRACDMGALAMGGVTTVPVVKKPVVAFIPTGNELVSPGEIPARGQNIDSNSIMVKNMLIEMGAEPCLYSIQKDNPAKIKECLLEAITVSDIVILNGGSSKGAEDYNAQLLAGLGTVICSGVKAAPGKPVNLAIIQDKAVINLPGPMLATYFGMDWCVRSIICHALGVPLPQRQKVKAVLTRDLFPKGSFANTDFELLGRLSVSRNKNRYEAWAVPFFDRYEGMRTVGFHNAQCAVHSSQGFAKGDEIEAELLYGLEHIKDITEETENGR